MWKRVFIYARKIYCPRCMWTEISPIWVLDPPKCLIIIVNWFRYINNNLTKDRCSIPMDITIVLGLLKFNLKSAIDHHGPSMYSGHYTTSINCCKTHSVATTANLRRLSWLIQNSAISYVVMYKLIELRGFGLEKGWGWGWGILNYSNGAGSSH